MKYNFNLQIQHSLLKLMRRKTNFLLNKIKQQMLPKNDRLSQFSFYFSLLKDINNRKIGHEFQVIKIYSKVDDKLWQLYKYF